MFRCVDDDQVQISLLDQHILLYSTGIRNGDKVKLVYAVTSSHDQCDDNTIERLSDVPVFGKVMSADEGLDYHSDIIQTEMNRSNSPYDLFALLEEQDEEHKGQVQS